MMDVSFTLSLLCYHLVTATSLEVRQKKPMEEGAMQEEMKHAELVAAAPLAQESMEVEIKAKSGLQMPMECKFKFVAFSEL